MKKEFFSTLEGLLDIEDSNALRTSFADFYEDFKAKKFYLESDTDSKDCKEFGTLKLCKAQIVSPLKINRPKKVCSINTTAKILHSVAHIECSAIILALDTAYRFKGMPLRFYEDWLEVASEEIRHFALLEELLCELGYKYGDFSVHNKLFEALCATSKDLSVRLGVVHRGLEAKGLDANPFVLTKLLQTTLPITKKLKEVFDIILCDEIGHVSKGDKWWRLTLNTLKTPYSFVDLCKEFEYFTLAGKVMNIDARLKAGFSQEELEQMQDYFHKSGISQIK
ncbi:MAG: DUF455 family protein [Helicobacter sp.]|nr:DUF455 family protein [Helicobacter sp.]MDD7567400.1 DUF455 family protein [Helicobacter sp.]MDY5740501.1 DUF455 family protein [Helicobacter sp.]